MASYVRVLCAVTHDKVTFAEAADAAKAVANANPTIDGKVCNCNLASLKQGTVPFDKFQPYSCIRPCEQR